MGFLLISREPREYLKSLRNLFTAAKKKRVFSGNNINYLKRARTVTLLQ